MKTENKINLIGKEDIKELKHRDIYHGQTLTPPVKSIHYLLNNLLPDEKIIKLVTCSLEGKSGVLGITSARVIFVVIAPSLGVRMTKDFLLNSLSSVNIQAGLVNSLHISTSNDKMEVKAIPTSELQEIVKALRSPESFNCYSVEELFLGQPVSKGSASIKVKNGKESGNKILRYIGSVILLLLAISWMASSEKGAIYINIAGFLFFITALSIAPFISKYISSKTRKQAAGGSLGLALILVIIGAQGEISKDKAQNAEADKSFSNVKTMILEGKFDSAAVLAKTIKHQYADTANNPAAQFLSEFDSIRSKEFINQSLLSLSNKEYQDLKGGTFRKKFLTDSILNASFLHTLMESASQRSKLIEEKRLEVEAAKEKAEYAERRKLIEKQFSPFDGSHRNLKKIIKADMNDEDSYEHIDTRFVDTGDYLTVKTTFSGKNAFNATVKQTVRAKVAIDGTVLSYEVIE